MTSTQEGKEMIIHQLVHGACRPVQFNVIYTQQTASITLTSFRPGLYTAVNIYALLENAYNKSRNNAAAKVGALAIFTDSTLRDLVGVCILLTRRCLCGGAA